MPPFVLDDAVAHECRSRFGLRWCRRPGNNASVAEQPGREGKNVMQRLWSRTIGFIKEEDGPTVVEYAVLLAMIVLIGFGILASMGVKVRTAFTTIEGTAFTTIEETAFTTIEGEVPNIP
jgi:pilus assembly protein Flp/PilA